MHSPEVRLKFMERRAQGWSLVRIDSELGIAPSSLIPNRWSVQTTATLRDPFLGMAPDSHPHFRSGRMDRFLDRFMTDFPMFEPDVLKNGKEMVNKR